MTDLDARVAALLPCPFCGHETPEFERMGTSGHSCIVNCGNCGCSHESGDEYLQSGRSWNIRAELQKPALHEPVADDEIDAAHKVFVNTYSGNGYRYPVLKVVESFLQGRAQQAQDEPHACVQAQEEITAEQSDDFHGDNEALCRSIDSLLNMDAVGALVPHGVGGHARTLLKAARARLLKESGVVR